jgi:arsenate reductase
MIKIYHNNRCQKSRLGVKFLEKNKLDFEIINYLNDPLSMDEIKFLLKKLKIKPVDLIRKNELIWKTNYKNKKLSDEEIVMAMVDNPILIERPIIVNGDKAIIGRPTEKISEVV